MAALPAIYVPILVQDRLRPQGSAVLETSFVGGAWLRPLASMALRMVAKRYGRRSMTWHGKSLSERSMISGSPVRRSVLLAAARAIAKQSASAMRSEERRAGT